MKAIVVDDLHRFREQVSRVLEAEGFEVRRFETADAAAAAISEPTWEVDLVVTDVQMPGWMDGVDLATMLATTRPGLPVVVMSSDPRELRRATAPRARRPDPGQAVREGRAWRTSRRSPALPLDGRGPRIHPPVGSANVPL